MERRTFFKRAGMALGAVPVLGTGTLTAAPATARSRPFNPDDWSSVRDQFSLTHSMIHMSSFLLASHPRPVAEAIEGHRAAFDADPATHWERNFMTAEPAVTEAAGEYLGVEPDYIGLTDSTTMGLGLVYGALRLEPDQEILTTEHDHYATFEALRLRAERTRSSINRIALYENSAQTSVTEVVDRMHAAITDRTRVFAVTWVHSSTGVKLPLAAMAEALREINARRALADRVLFCVDGVHGLGIEDATVEELGCDFFIAGTHKWLFGPRGTGIVYGRPEAWDALDLVIPNFGPWAGVWIGELPPDTKLLTPGNMFTPGGFHSFEHRWALGEAFRFHRDIGKSRVQDRIHALNSQAKHELAGMSHVRLYTPMSATLSSGIICFDIEGRTPDEVVTHLHERGIIASTSPYPQSYARIAPSLINNEDEVDRTVAAIAELG